MSLRKMSMTTEATWEHGKHVAGEQVTILAAGVVPLPPNTLGRRTTILAAGIKTSTPFLPKLVFLS